MITGVYRYKTEPNVYVFDVEKNRMFLKNDIYCSDYYNTELKTYMVHNRADVFFRLPVQFLQGED